MLYILLCVRCTLLNSLSISYNKIPISPVNIKAYRDFLVMCSFLLL